MSINKYRKLVAKNRGEWVTKWFGGSTDPNYVEDGNTIIHEELIVGYRRYSTSEEIYFHREYPKE